MAGRCKHAVLECGFWALGSRGLGFYGFSAVGFQCFFWGGALRLEGCSV